MKKKTLFLILGILLILSFFAYGYAKNLIEERAYSVFTYGNVKLKLIEKTLENGNLVDVNNKESINIANENKLSRIVSVKNVGNNPFYLRVKVVFSGISNNNTTKFDASELIDFEISDLWEEYEGYYYYKEAVNPGEETDYLMEEIEFDNSKLKQEYLGTAFNLDIHAEAVQSQNNASSAILASGWPEN